MKNPPIQGLGFYVGSTDLRDYTYRSSIDEVKVLDRCVPFFCARVYTFQI